MNNPKIINQSQPSILSNYLNQIKNPSQSRVVEEFKKNDEMIEKIVNLGYENYEKQKNVINLKEQCRKVFRIEIDSMEQIAKLQQTTLNILTESAQKHELTQQKNKNKYEMLAIQQESYKDKKQINLQKNQNLRQQLSDLQSSNCQNEEEIRYLKQNQEIFSSKIMQLKIRENAIKERNQMRRNLNNQNSKQKIELIQSIIRRRLEKDRIIYDAKDVVEDYAFQLDKIQKNKKEQEQLIFKINKQMQQLRSLGEKYKKARQRREQAEQQKDNIIDTKKQRFLELTLQKLDELKLRYNKLTNQALEIVKKNVENASLNNANGLLKDQ